MNLYTIIMIIQSVAIIAIGGFMWWYYNYDVGTKHAIIELLGAHSYRIDTCNNSIDSLNEITQDIIKRESN